MSEENINLANKIFYLSTKFDSLADKTKTENIFLMEKITEQIDDNLNKITSQNLKKICQRISDLHKKELEIHKKNQKNTKNEEKNILVLFIKYGCKKSLNFIGTDWEILKKYNKTGNKIKMITMLCDDTRYYKNLCEKFNITEYPSIRYITFTPTKKIHKYVGELNAYAIQETYQF